MVAEREESMQSSNKDMVWSILASTGSHQDHGMESTDTQIGHSPKGCI